MLKRQTLDLMTAMMTDIQPMDFYLSNNVENTLLFGVPIGAMECENALAALVKYGVNEEEWHWKRKLYLDLLKQHNIA